ncbi:MAG TPA: isoprenyl transferase [Bacillota bacterium]
MSSSEGTAWQRRVERLRAGALPRHVAIIMDGNGRWAHQRGLPRIAGHRASVEAVRDVVRFAGELGLEVLTLYAFSTENWKRPRPEVDALMDLLVDHVHSDLDELHANDVQVRVIGRVDELPAAPRAAVQRAMDRTAQNRGLRLVLALNYGGRRELADACARLAARVAAGELRPGDIDEGTVSEALYTAGLPDPDLLIRTSGELRISNFLLWQLAYTEFWVTDVCWPDFRRQHLAEALEAFQRRDRRFGGLPGGERA